MNPKKPGLVMSTNMSEERKGTVPYVTRRHYGLELDRVEHINSANGRTEEYRKGRGVRL